MSLWDAITVLNAGRKIAGGTPVEVKTRPDVVKASLGETVGAGD